MGVWCSSANDPRAMIERDPESEGYFLMLKPMHIDGTKSVNGRDESMRYYVDPSEYPELARDLDEWTERYEQEVNENPENDE